MKTNDDMYHLSLKNALKGNSKKLELISPKNESVSKLKGKSNSIGLFKTNTNLNSNLNVNTNKKNIISNNTSTGLVNNKRMNEKEKYIGNINNTIKMKKPNTNYSPIRKNFTMTNDLTKVKNNMMSNNYNKENYQKNSQNKYNKTIGLSSITPSNKVNKIKINSNKFYNNAGINSKNIKVNDLLSNKKKSEETLQKGKSMTNIVTQRSKTVNSNQFTIERKHKT